MSVEIWFDAIKAVANEQKFEVVGGKNKTTCSIYIDKWHAVAYNLKINGMGYIQAHQWECDKDGANGRYGRAVYSIRSYSDSVQFCSVLIASASIRAGRDQKS